MNYLCLHLLDKTRDLAIISIDNFLSSNYIDRQFLKSLISAIGGIHEYSGILIHDLILINVLLDVKSSIRIYIHREINGVIHVDQIVMHVHCN